MWIFYAVLVATLLEVAPVAGQEKYDDKFEKNFGSKTGYRVAYKRKDGTNGDIFRLNSVESIAKNVMVSIGSEIVTRMRSKTIFHFVTFLDGWEVCNTIFMDRSEVVGVRCKKLPKPDSNNPMDVKGYVCTTTTTA
ncbi:hypothetical protein Aduo_004259 [Ancylostoma duodenale]